MNGKPRRKSDEYTRALLKLSAGRGTALALALQPIDCLKLNDRAVNQRFMSGLSENRSMRNCNANENTKSVNHSHPFVGYVD